MSNELAKQEQAGAVTVVGKQKYLPSTLAEFLTIYSLKKVKRDLAPVKTIKQALEVQTPTLGLLRKQYGERQIEAYIKLWLIELNELLNATRPLTEAQIDETAYLILSEYYNISIADINIIFRKAKLGEYGDLYGTLSIDKILKWFGDYFNERGNVAGEMSRAEHDRIKYQDEKLYGDVRNSQDKGFEEFKKQYQIDELKKKYNEEQKAEPKGKKG